MTIPRELILGEVIDRTDWSPGLFSLTITADVAPYQAGQFLKLALQDSSGQWVRRAYSLVNAPILSSGVQQLEFLIIADPDGQLTPLLNQLSVGDEVYVSQQASGFMTAAEIPDYAKDLWLLSTGTAIGPFLSILSEMEPMERFDNLILVHAVRTVEELVYRDLIAELNLNYDGKLHYVPVVSREVCDWSLKGRIPTLLLDSTIANQIGCQLDPTRSFVYMCGNPSMVRDTAEVLVQLGLTKHLRRKPGQFSSENYW
jgi:ferredoxin--NADP+ reductase